ncbi:hypothetical protein VVT58_10240 [Sphingobium sp. SJ10-10]|uniref:hypothetical protein n=1 Tax=Sphingobium sp. SJ10-10 TaxID=3114999 RepID=UPI002E1866C3|nr:hypothetical protein [Sphingobium sp. SJ10-10]
MQPNNALEIDERSRRSASLAFIGRLTERHAGLLVAVIAALLCLPFIRSIWLLADEGIWLHAAQRILRGEILYRDFFEFHPPLGFLIVTGWVYLFGPSLVAARLLVMLVMVTTAWFTFSCCKIASGRPSLSAVITVSWIAAGQGLWTQVSHHWLTTMFSMIALWGVLSPRNRAGPAIAGIAASAATLVTTHRGALIVLAGFGSLFLQKSPQKMLTYIISGISLLGITICFIFLLGAATQAFDQVILWTIKQYSGIQPVPFGAFLAPQRLLVVMIFPLTFCLSIFSLVRFRPTILSRPHLGALVLFAIAGFVGCFPRPDDIHIAFSMVLALPLFATLLDTIFPKGHGTPVLRSAALLVCFVPVFPLLMSVRYVIAGRPVESAVGPIVVIPDNGTTELIERLKTLPNGDSVFFYPYDPVLPVLTGRRHPARLDLLLPQYTTPDQYRETCLEVMRGSQWVVIDEEIIRPSFYHAIFPAMRNPSPPDKVAFEAALRSGFELKGHYGDFSLLQRSAMPSGLCSQIAPQPQQSHLASSFFE